MAFKDPERRKQYNRDYYQQNKEGIFKREHKDPQTIEERRAYDNAYGKARRQGAEGDYVRYYHTYWRKTNSIRVRIILALGGKCVRCGFDDIRALQIDHINGGGTKDRAAFKNTYQYEKYVFEHLDSGGYQVLCANCNWIKRDEMQEHMWNKRE